MIAESVQNEEGWGDLSVYITESGSVEGFGKVYVTFADMVQMLTDHGDYTITAEVSLDGKPTVDVEIPYVGTRQCGWELRDEAETSDPQLSFCIAVDETYAVFEVATAMYMPDEPASQIKIYATKK